MTTSMHVHFTDMGPALHPAAPGAHILPGPSDASTCGEPTVWSARFTQGPLDDPSWDPLARLADFDESSPRLTWFIESVGPDGEALPTPPVPLRVEARLLSGDTVVASGATEALDAIDVEDRFVQRAQFRMAWRDTPVLPEDVLRLEVSAQTADPADCGAGPSWLRPYADAERVPRILWDLYEPVRIDRFDTGFDGDRLVIVVHASSPWGPLDLSEPLAPVITTPSGQGAEAELDGLDVPGAVQTVWSWDGATQNGTYRVDVRAQSADGAHEASNFTTFRIGGDPADAPVATPPPPQKTPGLQVPLLALALLALGRRVS